MTALYTRGGDKGTADACAGARVAKDDAVFDALGTVDELQCVLGVARCCLAPAHAPTADTLAAVQHTLTAAVCVALLPACTAAPGRADALARTLQDATAAAECAIDAMHLPPLRAIVVPGASGCLAAAQLHVCRAVCRRAERAVVRAVGTSSVLRGTLPAPLHSALLAYMNRCSDLLFACALYVDQNSQPAK